MNSNHQIGAGIEEPLAVANRKRAETATPPMWGLSQGLEVIRGIQDRVHALGFHVCLAGGVLNKGYSNKDLDLVFVPLTNEHRPAVGALCSLFEDLWGDLRDNLTDPNPCVSLRFQASYLVGAQRIDVFVV